MSTSLPPLSPVNHSHTDLQTVQHHPDGLDGPLHLASQLGIEGSIVLTHLDLLQPTGEVNKVGLEVVGMRIGEL